MFPSTAIDSLFHEMLLLGIPVEYTEWLYRCLEGRKTWLTFDDFRLELFSIDSGLDQGDPFSLICYLIYNASLINIPIKENGESESLYVDDACLIATGKNFTVTHTKISNMMHKPKGVLK
jgi:hypothetical protein